MSRILKGLLSEVNPHNYDSDWDYYDALNKPHRPKRNDDDFEIPDREINEPIRRAPVTGAKPEYSFSNDEDRQAGYNMIVTVKALTTQKAEWAAQSYVDSNWGAKKQIGKITPVSDGVVQVHMIDNHKYGMWTPWKGEKPIGKPLKFGENKEADYGSEYQDMVKRVGQMAKEGPRKTVYDPVKRVYKTVPVKQSAIKQGVAEGAPTLWEVSYDYGPHMTKSVTVKARSEEEARAKVEKNAQQRGFSIMINSVEPKEQGVAEETIHVGHRNSKGDWIKTSTHSNYSDAKKAMAELEKQGKKGVQHRYDNKGSIDPGTHNFSKVDEQGVAEAKPKAVPSSERDQGALATRKHISSQEQKHKEWAERQKELEKQFYANHPELKDSVEEGNDKEYRNWNEYEYELQQKAGKALEYLHEIDPDMFSRYGDEFLMNLANKVTADHPTASVMQVAGGVVRQLKQGVDEGQIYSGGNKQAGQKLYKPRTVPNQHELNKESAIMKGLQLEGNDEEYHTGGSLGTPYPSTYEQETLPYRTKGQKRTQSIAFEDKE